MLCACVHNRVWSSAQTWPVTSVPAKSVLHLVPTTKGPFLRRLPTRIGDAGILGDSHLHSELVEHTSNLSNVWQVGSLQIIQDSIWFVRGSIDFFLASMSMYECWYANASVHASLVLATCLQRCAGWYFWYIGCVFWYWQSIEKHCNTLSNTATHWCRLCVWMLAFWFLCWLLQKYMQDEGKYRKIKEWLGPWKCSSMTPPKVCLGVLFCFVNWCVFEYHCRGLTISSSPSSATAGFATITTGLPQADRRNVVRGVRVLHCWLPHWWHVYS